MYISFSLVCPNSDCFSLTIVAGAENIHNIPLSHNVHFMFLQVILRAWMLLACHV